LDPVVRFSSSEQNKLKKIHFFIKNDELQMIGGLTRH